MKRGWLAALIVAEGLVAGACALAWAFTVGLLTGFGQRAAYWHGPVPSRTSAELAEVNAASLAAFAWSFVIIFGVELALTAGVITVHRRAELRRSSVLGGQAAAMPTPFGVKFLTASFTYSIFATLPLALWAFIRSSPVDYLYLGTQAAAGAAGLWFALTPHTAHRAAVPGCVAVLWATSWLTQPFEGPALILWPVAALLLLTNESVRSYFGHSAPERAA